MYSTCLPVNVMINNFQLAPVLYGVYAVFGTIWTIFILNGI